MEMTFLVKGAIIGFSIAMAVGPIGLLCLRNALTKGFREGLATGLGAACADMVYGAFAGFGVTAITAWLVHYRMFLQIVGGLFLCYLGVRMLCMRRVCERNGPDQHGCWPIFITTFFLTMTNPMTILSFIAIYAGLGVGAHERSLIPACLVTSGVFVGSSLFYLLMSFIASRVKRTLTATGILWLNRISGGIIVGFGVVTLIM